MRRPPELGAIVPVHFSHDRYATDVHYYGGTLHVGESVYWPAEMVAENALPPDPERFGPGWRDAWLARLQATPQWPLTWLRHQRRDDYWRHGSACDDWAALTTPVLAIGGLHDAYREAVLAVLEHGAGPRRGLIGPWGHTWPHTGWPAPSVDGLGEMDRWWDRWLRDERNGADEEPMLRVYVQDPVPVEPFPERIAGRWWVADRWPLDAPPTVLALGPGEPLDGPGDGADVVGRDGSLAWAVDRGADRAVLVRQRPAAGRARRPARRRCAVAVLHVPAAGRGPRHRRPAACAPAPQRRPARGAGGGPAV